MKKSILLIAIIFFFLEYNIIISFAVDENNQNTNIKDENIVENYNSTDNDNTVENYNITDNENSNILFENNSQIINMRKNNYNKENGIYKIAVGKVPSKSIEIKGADISDNAIAGIWDYGNAPQQKFYFEYQEEGFYKITAMHTGKSLTIQDEKIEEGAQIVQYEYKGLDSQKWIFTDSNINGWVISSFVNPELSISIQGDIINGSKLILTKDNYNDNQMLYLYNISKEEQSHQDGVYKIAIGENQRKALEVEKNNNLNDAKFDISEFRKCIISKV